MRYLILLGILLLGAASTLAQRPDAPAYALRGPYAVGTRQLQIASDDRPLNVTLWYPAEAEPGSEPAHDYRLYLTFNISGHAYPDAPPAASSTPFPLIVFSHGSGASRHLALYYTEHLASYGFIVMAADHPGNNVVNSVTGGILGNRQDFAGNYAQRPFDVLRQIELAAELNAAGDLAGLIDLERIGVTGHSFGGWTALAAAGARFAPDQLAAWCDKNATARQPDNICFVQDLVPAIAAQRGFDAPPDGLWPPTTMPGISAVVALAPWNVPSLDLSAVTVPALIIVGSADDVTIPERDALPAYAALGTPKTLITLANAGHYIFVDQCPPVFIQFGFFAACSDLVWDMQRAHDLTNHYAAAFFRATLYIDPAARAALNTTTAAPFVGVTFQSER